MNSIPLALASDRTEIVFYALAILTILYVVFRPMLRKRKDPLERTPLLGVSTQKAVERDMQNLLVELSEMARQITAQLETRAAKLQLMIDEADRKIAELKRMSGEQPIPAQTRPTMRLVPAEEHLDAPADKPHHDPEPDEPATDPRHAEIHALADRGRSPKEIAQQLGRPVGEIELILALRMK